MVMDLVLDPDVITTFTDFAYVNATRPNISAVLEPDVDGDEYGDLSQDAVPPVRS